MHMTSIHPLSGNVCQMPGCGGRDAIRVEYLSTILVNITWKAASTPAVISNSHHRLAGAMPKYAIIPLTLMMSPGIPQMHAAVKYRTFLFISD